MNIFSQSLRYQLENTNIKVMQAIMPLVDTAMTHGRGTKKMLPKEAASEIIQGIENEIDDNYIGKVKILRTLIRFTPSIAKKIMKGN